MRLKWLAILLALCPPVVCFAGGDASSRLKAIQTDVANAEAAFRKVQMRDGGPVLSPEGQRLYDIWRHKQAEGESAIIQIAKDDPKSDAGYAALEWFLVQPELYDDEGGVSALKLTATYYPGDARLGRAIAKLSHYAPRFEREPAYAPAVQLLQSVVDKNPDRTIRGQAALGLAWLAKWRSELAMVQNLPDQDKLGSVAEAAYESLIRDYGACPNLYERNSVAQTKTLGEKARRDLFELQHLRIGKPAPEIAGEDIFDKSLKLSDYRGKVVLLVFWSSWCGPCMAEVPDERNLVEHFGARPFVIVGVNGDSDKALAQKTAAKSNITWRSFWNGGPGGPITTEWNIGGWPAVYVIDPKGIIRYRDLNGVKLHAALEQLVGAAEQVDSKHDQ